LLTLGINTEQIIVDGISNIAKDKTFSLLSSSSMKINAMLIQIQIKEHRTLLIVNNIPSLENKI